MSRPATVSRRITGLVLAAAVVGLVVILGFGWLVRDQPEPPTQPSTPLPTSTYQAPPPNAEVGSPFDDQ